LILEHLAFSLNFQEKYEEAIPIFEEILKLTQPQPSEQNPLSADLYFETGRAFMSGSNGDVLLLGKAQKYFEVKKETKRNEYMFVYV